MISIQMHLDDLGERISTITRLVDATHPDPKANGAAREARGLAVVLLFASYENLLTTLTRTLLEGAVKCKVSNSRLRPGFRLFTVDAAAKSLRDVAEKKIYAQALPSLIATIGSRDRPSSINTDAFPSDGSYFRRSQIQVWCEIFDVPNPQRLLMNIWQKIDAVVVDRNAIAHGRLTPEEVGRRFTEDEMRTLVTDWQRDWSAFLTQVGELASSREFFRLPR